MGWAAFKPSGKTLERAVVPALLAVVPNQARGQKGAAAGPVPAVCLCDAVVCASGQRSGTGLLR